MESVQYHADIHHLRILLILNRNMFATDSVSINICGINISINMIPNVKHPPESYLFEQQTNNEISPDEITVITNGATFLF